MTDPEDPIGSALVLVDSFSTAITGLRNLSSSQRSMYLNLKLVVGTGFGPVAFVAFGLRLGHEAGGLRPPLASPAPTSLACPHAEE